MAQQHAEIVKNIQKWQSTVAEILFIFLMCALPLYLNSQRYIGLTAHKYRFFVFGTGVLICVSAVILILGLVKSQTRFSKNNLVRFLKRRSVVDRAMLGFAAVTLLSTFLTPYPEVGDSSGKYISDIWNGIQDRHDGAITQLFFVASFLILAYWYKPRTRDFAIFGITAAVIASLGIFQFFGMDFFRLWPNHMEAYAAENFYNIHFRSTLGNINIVSTYACIATLLCGFLYVFTETRYWKYVWLAGSALNLWMLVFTSDSGRVGVALATLLIAPFIATNRRYLSRFLILSASWVTSFTLHRLLYNHRVLETESTSRLTLYAVTAVVLLIAGIVLTLIKAEPDHRLRWKPGVIILAAIVLIGIAGIEVMGRRTESETNPIYQAREILHGRIADEFGTNRVYIWRNALSEFPHHSALIGSGPDTFLYAFPDKAHLVYGEVYDKAHNEYLQILICQGILGLLCFLVFLGALLIKSVRKVLKNTDPLLLAVTVAFIGYCVQAFFNISLPIASQTLWCLAGVMASICKNPQSSLNFTSNKQPNTCLFR
jgi:hypothetical protein